MRERQEMDVRKRGWLVMICVAALLGAAAVASAQTSDFEKVADEQIVHAPAKDQQTGEDYGNVTWHCHTKNGQVKARQDSPPHRLFPPQPGGGAGAGSPGNYTCEAHPSGNGLIRRVNPSCRVVIINGRIWCI